MVRTWTLPQEQENSVTMTRCSRVVYVLFKTRPASSLTFKSLDQRLQSTLMPGIFAVYLCNDFPSLRLLSR